MQRRCVRQLSASLLLERHQGSEGISKSLDLVPLVKSTVLLGNTKANIEVDCLRCGMMMLEPADGICTRRETSPAQGIAEVESEKPFLVRVSIFIETPVRLEAGRKTRDAIKMLYLTSYRRINN